MTPLVELKRLSGLGPDEVPGTCDENFYFLDKRLSLLENDFSYVREYCGEAKNSLASIEKSIQELKDCVKPRLAEFGTRIGNIESSQEKNENGNENGNGLPSRKTIILLMIVALMASSIAGAGGSELLKLFGKLFGVN